MLDRADAGDAQPAPDLPSAISGPARLLGRIAGKMVSPEESRRWRRKKPDRSRSAGHRSGSVRSRIRRSESLGGGSLGRDRGVLPCDSEDRIGDDGALLSVSTNPAMSTRSPTATGWSDLSAHRFRGSRRECRARNRAIARVTLPRRWTRWKRVEKCSHCNNPSMGMAECAKGSLGAGSSTCTSGEIRRLKVDADHLAVGIHSGRGVGMNPDLGVDQVGIRCAGS